MKALGITVAQEVREMGIRVTNIYPGEVDTPILENRPVPVTAEHRARILKPEDVAAVLVTIAALPPEPTSRKWSSSRRSSSSPDRGSAPVPGAVDVLRNRAVRRGLSEGERRRGALSQSDSPAPASPCVSWRVLQWRAWRNTQSGRNKWQSQAAPPRPRVPVPS